LFYCDEDLKEYDTNLKVNPPLRTSEDRDALRKAVLDGTIDCIASHHSPHENDSKVVEFENARNGMISLQTSFAVVNTVLRELSIERLVELFCTTPRTIFNLPVQSIREGNIACLSLFEEHTNWKFDRKLNHSLSVNSPFFGKELSGKPFGIINKDQLFLNEYLEDA
jgi:dihydroorotase